MELTGAIKENWSKGSKLELAGVHWSHWSSLKLRKLEKLE
jgi:hypothetical protein